MPTPTLGRIVGDGPMAGQYAYRPMIRGANGAALDYQAAIEYASERNGDPVPPGSVVEVEDGLFTYTAPVIVDEPAVPPSLHEHFRTTGHSRLP